MRTWLSLLLFTVAALIALPGCPTTPEPPGEDLGTVVVGVTSDLRAGVDIETLRVRLLAGGQVLRDDTLSASADGVDKLAFPLELRFADQLDGAEIEVSLEAFPTGWTAALLTRTAASRIVGGKSLLLRVHLDSACAAAPGSPSASDCAAGGETCIDGACRDPFVDPAGLPIYSPAWNDGSPDICKAANAGEPIVIVGKGMSDYLPMDDLEVGQVEAGPQGGHHIWVAIRMKNLHQSGSITEVTGYVADLDLEIPPFNVIFTFDQDEGGYCKLYGLRYQLDIETEITPLLGRVIEVTVKVKDADGDVGVGSRMVTLSSDIIG